MSRVLHALTSAALMTGLASGAAAAQTLWHTSSVPAMRPAVIGAGSVSGTVRDRTNRPVAGAVVSAVGSTVALAVTDDEGRFELSALPSGVYVLRAHLGGFGASTRERVAVAPGRDVTMTVRLDRVVLAAGLVQLPGVETDEPAAPAAGSDEAHEHSERAWRLRHLRRSVLRETSGRVAHLGNGEPAFDPDFPAVLGRAVESSARFAAALFHDVPFSGEVNFLTTSSVMHAGDLLSPDEPRGVAFVSIGAPAGDYGDWAVQAAVTHRDISSWVLAGAFTSRAPSPHAYEVGLSYGTQEYGGGNPAALAAVSDGQRNVGAVQAFDDWTVSRRVSLEYGARYAWYDYLDSRGHMSPRLGVTVRPAAQTSVRVGASQRSVAPGAEEFLPPPTSGLWLPPERTFSPLVSTSGFRVERVRQVDVGLERSLGEGYAVNVRRFYQAVSDQLATLFGIGLPGDPDAGDLGHYYVATVGSVRAEGWAVSLGGTLVRGVQGSVEYTLTDARWSLGPEARYAAALAATLARPQTERFHDITTLVEAEIPETSTRMHVIYKMNTGYARPEPAGPGTGRDSRFDVQLNQSLPFLSFTSARWELLVAVRNLFREPADDVSPYDELLVLRPPKRVVGGLLLRF